VLSLVALCYVDEATLSEGMRWVARVAFPAAVLMASGYFLWVLSPEATEPNALIYLATLRGFCWRWGFWSWGLVLSGSVGRRANPFNHP
jgi:hypothetical protein